MLILWMTKSNHINLSLKTVKQWILSILWTANSTKNVLCLTPACLPLSLVGDSTFLLPRNLSVPKSSACTFCLAICYLALQQANQSDTSLNSVKKYSATKNTIFSTAYKVYFWKLTLYRHLRMSQQIFKE